MREIIEPMEKEGLFSELRDENDKFVGYVLTETGRRTILG
jgi:DNA-binding MarR family transcriptional regulator